jgi:hypothetical protein
MYRAYVTDENVRLAERLSEDYNGMQLPPETPPWNGAVTAKCERCLPFRCGTDTRPARPEGGSVDDLTYICRHCSRRWWQFNSHYHFWKEVTELEEWNQIRRWQIMLNGGFGMPGDGQ